MNSFEPRILRYLVSGGLGFLANLGSYYVLQRIIGLYYLYAAIIAFIISFILSFFLQKFWTFQNKEKDFSNLHRQASFHLSLLLFNLIAATSILYLLVELIGLWDILALVLANGFMAIISYFIYKNFIFKPKSLEETQGNE